MQRFSEISDYEQPKRARVYVLRVLIYMMGSKLMTDRTVEDAQMLTKRWLRMNDP